MRRGDHQASGQWSLCGQLSAEGAWQLLGCGSVGWTTRSWQSIPCPSSMNCNFWTQYSEKSQPHNLVLSSFIRKPSARYAIWIVFASGANINCLSRVLVKSRLTIVSTERWCVDSFYRCVLKSDPFRMLWIKKWSVQLGFCVLIPDQPLTSPWCLVNLSLQSCWVIGHLSAILFDWSFHTIWLHERSFPTMWLHQWSFPISRLQDC